MITPQEESYRANQNHTSPLSFGSRSLEPALNEAEDVSGMMARTREPFEPRQVVELRAFKGRETVSGYFDDREALAQAAASLDGQGYAVYVTLNEVDPALLARAANRARKVYKEPTTSDSDSCVAAGCLWTSIRYVRRACRAPKKINERRCCGLGRCRIT